MTADAPPAGRRVLALFDLDGTITRHDTMVPWLLALLLRRLWRLLCLPLAAGAIGRYCIGRGDRGQLKGALLRALAGGVTRAQIAAHNARWLPPLLRNRLFAEAIERIAWHRAAGHRLVLLSASPDLYVPDIAARLGFDECLCTAVTWRADGTLDGRLAGDNCRGPVKLERLRVLRAHHSPEVVHAYGNSRADLDHLLAVEHAYFVNGSRKVTSLPANVTRLHWQRHGGVTTT